MSADLLLRIDILEEENRYLRELLVPTQSLPQSWGLTAAETRLAICLSKAEGILHKSRIDIAVGALEFDPKDKTLEVILCRLRRKLAPLGVKILNIRGIGLTMEPEGRAVIRDALATVAAGAVA